MNAIVFFFFFFFFVAVLGASVARVGDHRRESAGASIVVVLS
jgi:hypothetical protein